MRRVWTKFVWQGAVVLCLAGCWKSGPNLRPPEPPEEYTLPPASDPRFSSPAAYPKEALGSGLGRRPAVGSPGRFEPIGPQGGAPGSSMRGPTGGMPGRPY